MLEACVLLRPVLVAIAYPEASRERVDTKFEFLRELIYDIRGLRLDSYGIAERLRSWRRT
jgi:hypothetical protein